MERGRLERFRTRRNATAICVLALLAAVPPGERTSAAPAGTLDRIRETGRLRLGYPTQSRPFAYRDASGNGQGYSIALCQRIADAVRDDLQSALLTVEWVPVDVTARFRAVQDGAIDLLCGGDTATLERRRDVSFSIAIFPGGIGALLRSDAPVRLRDVLEGRGQTFRPTWRAAATRLLEARAFSAVAGTTSEKWLEERIDDLHIATTPSMVASYDAGVQALLARRTDVFFGERAILLDAARQASERDLIVLPRLFTYEPLALTLPRDDERFRLLVDSALSRFYGSGELGALYTKWFGEPDQSAVTFFKWSMLPR